MSYKTVERENVNPMVTGSSPALVLLANDNFSIFFSKWLILVKKDGLVVITEVQNPR